MTNRRHERRQERLSAEQIVLLDRLGMVWDPAETAWWERLTAVREHHTRTGQWPNRWLQNLRGAYRRGRLNARQITELDALGMVWQIRENVQRAKSLLKNF